MLDSVLHVLQKSECVTKRGKVLACPMDNLYGRQQKCMANAKLIKGIRIVKRQVSYADSCLCNMVKNLLRDKSSLGNFIGSYSRKTMLLENRANNMIEHHVGVPSFLAALLAQRRNKKTRFIPSGRRRGSFRPNALAPLLKKRAALRSERRTISPQAVDLRPCPQECPHIFH